MVARLAAARLRALDSVGPKGSFTTHRISIVGVQLPFFSIGTAELLGQKCSCSKT